MITVEQVAKFVAPHIGKRWPYDQEAILDNLYLTAEEIWKSGKFHGSTKWFYVNTRSDNTIITPHGYSILLGLNQNFKPVQIRQDTFLFHQNGPGELPTIQGYSKDVIDLGEYPVFTLLDNLCKPHEGKSSNLYQIGARIIGDCSGFPKTRIYGNDKNGNPIYSYVKSKNGKEEICQCTEEEAPSYDDAIEGVELALNNVTRSYNILFSQITGIVKEATKSPVEYYAIDKYGLAKMVARLEPFESTPSYRIYKIPKPCISKACALGLFKIKKPDKYISGSQAFISENLTAVLSIAMGVDKKYKRNEFTEGLQYISDGLMSLANEIRENKSNAEDPIQVSVSSLPKKRRFI